MYLRKKRGEAPIRFRLSNRLQLLACLVAFAFPAFALFSRAQTAAQSTQSGDQPLLTTGVPITRELSGGQSHSYQLALAQGQYLEAVVEQRGIDVVVVVFAPNGQKVIEVDSPNGTAGPEPVWMIAETAGDYRLEVRSLEKNAAVGRYEVKVEQLRVPTAQDRSRIAALLAFGEASQLRQQGTVEAVRQAVAKYEESLPGWQAAGDQMKEAETLSSLGFLYHNYLGETLKARDYHERELPLQRALGNQAAEAVALNNLGQIYFSLGEMQKSLEGYGQSLALRRAVRDRRGEAVVLDHLGQVYSRMGQSQRALEHQQQALAIFRELSEPRHEGVALGNLSDTWSRMGEYERALEYNNQALALVRVAKDQLQEAIFLNNTGTIYFNLGEWRKAIDYYQQALALHRKSGNRHQEAYALTNIGVAFLSLLEYERALDYLRQALPLHRAAGAQRGEAVALFHLGAVYRITGKAQQARESFEAALALSQAVEDPNLEANIRDALSLVAQDRGDFPAARSYSEQAIELTESARAAVSGGHSRAAFLASKQTFYEHYIDLLMRMHGAHPEEGNDVAALRVSGSARARSLLELLTEARADIRQGIDPLLLARERALQQQLNVRAEAQTKLLSGKHTDARAAAMAKEIATLTDQLQQVETQIRAGSPRYAALTQPQPLTVGEIQKQLLDEDTLLLEYALGEKRSYLWAVTPTSLHSYELPPRAEIETAARKVYELLTARQSQAGLTEAQQTARMKKAEAEYPARAAALSRMLLAPVAAQLGKKRLVIVASGVLDYLPFAALPAPLAEDKGGTVAASLLATHEIINLPSASVLAVLRGENAARQVAPKTVAVFADPVFTASDPRVGAISKASKNRSPAAPLQPVTALLANGPADNNAKSEPELARAMRGFDLSARGDLSRLPFSREEAEIILAFAPSRTNLKALSFDASRAMAMGDDLR
ncbi:MAG: tetratricopeptide repeat protein, partial [Acidobacteriota bacterium]|nr:tetratricopeptide repeat protein [Acidobacteriota bacterium]